MVVFYALFYKNLWQIRGCYATKGSRFPELLAFWCLALRRNTVYLARLQGQPIVRHFGKVLLDNSSLCWAQMAKMTIESKRH